MSPFSKPDGSAVVDASNIVLFGLNAMAEANPRSHLAHLFDNAFRVVTVSTVQRAPEDSAVKALGYMRDQGVDHVLVHLDVDVIDPGEFPLSNVPSWMGLGYAQAMRAVKVFLGSEMCVGGGESGS